MASSGPKFPGTTASAALGAVTWSNHANVTATDGTTASASMEWDGSNNTFYLRATNFGFTIPTNAVIDGIEVVVKRRDTGGSTKDYQVRIHRSGSVGSTEKAKVGYWPTTLTETTYGSSSDLWGTTWTPAIVNGSDFGFNFSAQTDAPPPTVAHVDSITITVYYTIASFVPANFGTCIFHHRASAAGVVDGAAVSSATSLTGLNMSGVLSGNPTYDATSLLNNRPGIVYSRTGQDDGLVTSSVSDYLTGATSGSFAMVCRFAAVDATTQYLFNQTVPAPRLLRFGAYQVTGGVIGCYASSSGTSNEGLSAGSTVAANTNYVIVGTVTFDAGGTAGTMKLWVNNTLVVNKTDVAGTAFVATTPVYGMGIGILSSTGANGFDGCINEFAMWSTGFTDAQARDVYSRLYNDYLTPAVQCPPQCVMMS